MLQRCYHISSGTPLWFASSENLKLRLKLKMINPGLSVKLGLQPQLIVSLGAEDPSSHALPVSLGCVPSLQCP